MTEPLPPGKHTLASCHRPLAGNPGLPGYLPAAHWLSWQREVAHVSTLGRDRLPSARPAYRKANEPGYKSSSEDESSASLNARLSAAASRCLASALPKAACHTSTTPASPRCPRRCLPAPLLPAPRPAVLRAAVPQTWKQLIGRPRSVATTDKAGSESQHHASSCLRLICCVPSATYLIRVHQEFAGVQPCHVLDQLLHPWHACGTPHQQHLQAGKVVKHEWRPATPGAELGSWVLMQLVEDCKRHEMDPSKQQC